MTEALVRRRLLLGVIVAGKCENGRADTGIEDRGTRI